ncbi:MAG: hypothetical protein J6X37_05665 [Treponema sp.]|nr:hypothetical protein [Treponema sp.]
MKNKILILSIIFAGLANLSFAQTKEKNKTIDTPLENQVIVVGRIHFSTDADRNYLFDAFEIPEDRREFKDICVLPFSAPEIVRKPEKNGNISYVSETKLTLSTFNKNAWVANDNYFFIKYNVWKDRTIHLTSATVFIGGCHLLPVILPMYFKIKVPENEKYVYIGDFYYSAKGLNFELSVKVKDEFDSAQKALDAVTKNEVTLCRVSKEPFDEDVRILFSYPPIQSEIKGWYSHVKKVSEEAEQ